MVTNSNLASTIANIGKLGKEKRKLEKEINESHNPAKKCILKAKLAKVNMSIAKNNMAIH